MSESEDGVIREKLNNFLTVHTELKLRATFIKAMLGLLQEISSDRDQRMGFEGPSK